MATPLFSIGGLASGLDTASIIQQMMDLERIPVTRFQQRQAQLRKVDDAWGTVTTKLSAVRAGLDALRTPAVTDLRSVASSDADVVTAAVAGTPAAGAFTFRVRQLATAHQLSATFTSDDQLVGAGSLHIDAGGETLSLTTTESTTVADLARDINALNGAVRAQVLRVNDGETRLLLTATGTGSAGALQVTATPPAVGALTTLQAPRDAELVIGDDDEVVVTRSSNTVSDLVDGVTLTLRRVSDDPVTVTTSNDVDSGVKKIKALVDAVNGALSTMKDLSAYNPDAKTAGVLQGDSTVRTLVSDLRAAVSAGVAAPDGGSTSLSAIGIGLDRFGAVTLDEAKLRSALAEDPDTVARLVPGVADELDRVLERAEGGRDVKGLISIARESLRGEIRRYDDRISEFEVRLASRETTLRRQFAALESALANAQSQGAWLSSQLGAWQA